MAQGQLKGISKQKNNSASSRHAAKAAAATKKGKRYVAPKKTAAVKSAVLHKVRLFISDYMEIKTSDDAIGICRS
jgi:hypothetical protein